MKLKRLITELHPALGPNFVLDLCDATGEPAATVILAGDNGAGKTATLELIADAGTLEFRHDRRPEVTAFHYSLTTAETDWLFENSKSHIQVAPKGRLERSEELRPEAILTIDRRRGGTWQQFKLDLLTLAGEEISVAGELFSKAEARRIFKIIYSSAEISFEHHDIQSVTTQDVDREYQKPLRSSGNLATQIAQLLVDVQSLDDALLAKWVRENPGIAPPPNVVDVRMARFKSAFDFMFPAKRYAGVVNVPTAKEIQFSENARTMTINQLSSGEKQIVFRGSFLLKDQSSIKDAIVLIDEPEISLHPNWQLKVVEFYRKLFEDSEKTQTAQIIFATHSPFIIHNAVDEKIIVLERKTDGFPSVSATPSFPAYSSAAMVEKAFNFRYVFPRLTKGTIVLVEGESDELILSAAWQKLRDTTCPFEIVNALCASHIRMLLSRSEIFEKYADKRFVGLFDFDDAYNEWNGLKWPTIQTDASLGLSKENSAQTGCAMLIPVPAFRKDFASQALGDSSTLSIEFLFEDKDIPSKYTENVLISQLSVTQKRFRNSKKIEFAKLVQGWERQKFVHFEHVLKVLEARS